MRAKGNGGRRLDHHAGADEARSFVPRHGELQMPRGERAKHFLALDARERRAQTKVPAASESHVLRFRAADVEPIRFREVVGIEARGGRREDEHGSPIERDTGVIDPLDMRKVLALGLDAASRAPIEPTTFGVFRM